MMWLAVAATWISCAAVSIAGLYITKNLMCLLVMLIPAMMKYSSSSNSKD